MDPTGTPKIRLTGKERRRLADDLVASVHSRAPDWTSFDESDPGIAMLEVMAFVAEQLIQRAKPISEGESSVLARLIDTLATLRGRGCAESSDLTRVRYYSGQLLSASDFQLEQDYHRDKVRLQNLALAGSGVVIGLEVSVDDGSVPNAPVVSVEPGSAVAPNGELLVLCEPRVCTFSATVSAGFVALRFSEHSVKRRGASVKNGQSPASRISEGVAIEFHAQSPPNSVAIARLSRKASGWAVDLKFKPAKSR